MACFNHRLSASPQRLPDVDPTLMESVISRAQIFTLHRAVFMNTNKIVGLDFSIVRESGEYRLLAVPWRCQQFNMNLAPSRAADFLPSIAAIEAGVRDRTSQFQLRVFKLLMPITRGDRAAFVLATIVRGNRGLGRLSAPSHVEYDGDFIGALGQRYRHG